MKKSTLIVGVLAVAAFAFSTLAVKAGGVPEAVVVKTVAGKKMPGPIFPHKIHLTRGLKCMTCHPKPGTPELQANLNSKEAWHKACGDCHAGKGAAPDVTKDCAKCHK